VKSDVLSAESIGKDLVNDFVNNRLIDHSAKFHDRITQRKLKTFEAVYSVSVSVEKQRSVSVKADRDLFRRVIIALESGREVDVDTLLEHELSPVPLSLANLNQKLRYPTNKADLGKILEQGLAQNQPPDNLDPTCTILDGMAIVQSLGNRSEAKTFGEWSDNFQQYVNSQFTESCKRVDIVFDRYQEMSVKEGTRAKRSRDKGKGIKRMVESKDQKIANWERFIALGENNASLANFLHTELKTTHQTDLNRELILSGGFTDPKEAWSSTGRDMSNLSSSHEEGDTRIMLHAQDAKLSGFKQVNVVCRDTDVIVLLVAHLPRICEHVWMQAGTAKMKRNIPIHRIDISDEMRASLLAVMLHPGVTRPVSS
jgi:hypothetical protein